MLGWRWGFWGIKPRASFMVDKHLITELHPWPSIRLWPTRVYKKSIEPPIGVCAYSLSTGEAEA